MIKKKGVSIGTPFFALLNPSIPQKLSLLPKQQHQQGTKKDKHIRNIEYDSLYFRISAPETEIIHHMPLCKPVAEIIGSAADDHGNSKL